jgi:hypothetical protein
MTTSLSDDFRSKFKRLPLTMDPSTGVVYVNLPNSQLKLTPEEALNTAIAIIQILGTRP